MKKKLLLVLMGLTMIGCGTGVSSTPTTSSSSSSSTTSSMSSSETSSSSSSSSSTSSEVTPSPNPRTFRMEFEEHEMIDNAPEKDALRIETSDKASNGECVAWFRTGDKLRFTFNSSVAEENVGLTICASSCQGLSYNSDYSQLLGVAAVPGSKLSDLCFLNDTVVTGWEGQFNASGNKDTTGKYPVADYHNFSTVKTTINLKQGTNVLEIRGDGTNFNWDYVELNTLYSEITSDREVTSGEGSSSGGGNSTIGANEVDVYFIAGQSNAAGCSDFYRSDNTTLNLSEKYAAKAEKYINGFENVYYYGKAYDTNISSLTNYDTLTPVTTGMGITYTHDFGAELGMAEYLNNFYEGSNKKAVIVKYAVCASALLGNSGAWGEWSTPSYPNPSLTEPNLYEKMFGTSVNNYNDGIIYDAIEEIAASGVNKINYKGFYWSQGESDTYNKAPIYGDALTALIGDIRTDVNKIGNTLKDKYPTVEVGSSSELPFLISEIAPTQGGATKNPDGTSSDAGINELVAKQRLVAETVKNCATLPTTDYDIINQKEKWQSSEYDGVSYCADSWHYNGDDMLEIGNSVGEILYTFNETREATVTFDGNGCPTTIDSKTVKVNQRVTKPETPEFKHTDPYGKTYTFVFENWYYGEKVWNFDEDVITTNITLRANWTLEDSYFQIDPNAHVRTEGTTARIMSFNILCDDYNNKPAVNDERANQGFNTIERYAPDVVGLQEFDDEWYNQANKLLDGYKVINDDNRKVDGNTNYSTLTYNTSTVKVIDYMQKTLRQSDNPNCRKILLATFEFIAGENIGKQFIVGSTHWDLQEPQRVLQASYMADDIAEYMATHAGLPLMMTGDFNAREDAESYNKFVTKTGFQDTKLTAEEKGIICNTIHLGTPMRTGDRNYKDPNHTYRDSRSFSSANILNTTAIDHIFATTDITSLYHSVIIDEDALSASDHAPIYSDLKF